MSETPPSALQYRAIAVMTDDECAVRHCFVPGRAAPQAVAGRSIAEALAAIDEVR